MTFLYYGVSLMVLGCVYGIKTALYTKTDRANLRPQNSIVPLFTVKSIDVAECSTYCIQTTTCESVFYSSLNGLCRGYSLESLHKATLVTERTTRQFSVEKTKDCVDHGFTRQNGTSLCINIYLDENDWHTSRQLCQREGADLAILDTEEKVNLTTDYIKNYSTDPSVSRWYIGMTDEAKEGTWKWTNNELVDLPDYLLRLNGGLSQSVATLSVLSSSGILTDSLSKRKRARICELRFV